jgi:hypothetical protein
MILSIIEGHLITLHKYFNPLFHPSTLVIVPHTWVEDITILAPLVLVTLGGWFIIMEGGG